MLSEKCHLQAASHRESAPARQWHVAAVVGLVCVSLLVSPVLLHKPQNIVLESKDLDTDELSGNLLGALEKAMDKSIDNKVEAYMTAPAVASIPVPDFPDAPHEQNEDDDSTAHFVPKSYLDHLQAERKKLEEKRGKLMNELRAEHTAVATEAAKQSAEANKVRLESALFRAKKRQLEHAQDAARVAAQKMREALIAKQQAIHAEAVAKVRAHILDSMEDEAAGDDEEQVASYKQQTTTVPSQTTLTDTQPVVQHPVEAKALPKKVDRPASKLARYEAQEKQLLSKIAAAKRAANHAAAEATGGSGANEGGKQAMEGKVIETLAKTVKKNQGEIESDEAKAAALKKRELALLATVKALKGSDTSMQVKEKMLTH